MEWARAICYSGYREGQSPQTCTYPTYEQIKEDIKILYNMGFKYIRMYDPIVYSEMTCQVIRDMKYDMQMMQSALTQEEKSWQTLLKKLQAELEATIQSMDQ